MLNRSGINFVLLDNSVYIYILIKQQLLIVNEFITCRNILQNKGFIVISLACL